MDHEVTWNGITYYGTPRYVVLRYHAISDDPFMEPQEAEVTFQINGCQEKAFAPLDTVDKDNRSVQAMIIGEGDETYLVSFPPTNFGKTSFTAKQADLESIRVY